MELVNIQIGKIYRIRSPHTEKIYIGSTVKHYLCSRLAEHNADYKLFVLNKKNYTTSFDIIKLGDAYIELIELYPFDTKDKLNKREGELIREHKINCVNMLIPGRTRKEYYHENADYRNLVQASNKRYRLKNKDKIKQYYIDNKIILKNKRENKKIVILE